MNLEKFNDNKHKKNIWVIVSICFVLLLSVVVIYRTFAVYEEKEEYDVIEGKVPSYISMYDVKVKVEVDGVGSIKIPDKGSKKVESITCDKGAEGLWDYANWMIVVRNLTEAKTTCTVSFASKYTESILNGTDPELGSGLIPVVIEDDGTVKKADEGSEWYKYEEKKWANAVILNDDSIEYQEGEVIPESNIESYFVWIPRFKYQIFNDGKYEGLTKVENRVQEIKVVFEKNTVERSNGTGVGSWLTHPAFTSFDVNGMWVGKFETGYKGSGSNYNVTEPESIQIKPNVNSWRNIQVSNAFYTSYDYKRDYNSHMMKNTEWGAVAYLQHSKYGSMSSVRINNNSAYVTGYSATKEPTCGYTATNEECNKYGTDASVTQAYNTTIGYLASTTSNISGVYDMAGGAWEYVMGVMLDKSGNPMSGRNSKFNSGFNGTLGCPTCDGDTSGLTSLTTGRPFPNDARYYDTYEYAEVDEKYDRRILGDATGEMGSFALATYGSLQRKIGSWHQDESWFVASWDPWFGRGCNYSVGSGAGVFSFVDDGGRVSPTVSFRVVLSM